MNTLASYVMPTHCKWNRPILAIITMLGIAICSSAGLAQSGAGSIQGTVMDSSGAAVAGASVHVVNQATGVATDTKTNGVGFYQVPDLFTGTYDIIVSAHGMKGYKTSLGLLVNQSAVINPVLTVGDVTEQVVVAGDAAQLTTTDSGSLSSTLEDARISQIPMNGRSMLTLTQLSTPGLEDGGQKINGLMPEALEYVVDGATTTEVLNGGELDGFTQMVDPDSVQQVSMQVNGSGAQFALPATGILTTKSGTNRVHGTFFETARNNGWGIAKSRADPANLVAPHYVRNEFGGSAGGPIVLPHLYHGKDKSFWFFSFERYSLATSSPVLASVPTQAMSQGDFSGLVNGSGIQQVLYDPATTTNAANCAATGKANQYCRTPFLNNQIPIGRISPVAKIYYQLMPQPTSAANPLVGNNFNITQPSLQKVPQATFRLDHVFNENNRAYLGYTEVLNGVDTSASGPLNLAAAGIPAGAATGYTNFPTWSFNARAGFTHVFSSSFFSETILSQQWFNHTHVYGVAPNVNYEHMLGLPNNFGEVGFPALGNGTLIQDLAGSQNGTESDQIISNIDENLTKTMGRHQLQFGGRYRHIRVMDMPQYILDTISANAMPTALYNTASSANYTAVANTGYADASFFIGSASGYSVTLEPPRTHYHMMEFDAYVQDNYQVNKSLTVNLGLRYEAHPALWYKYGLANGFDLKNDAMVLAVPPATLIAEGYTTQAIITNDENIGIKFETPAQAGMPSALLRNYDLNFMPRVGIAYQPFGGRHGTVIRGAYGRYDYQTGFSNWSNQTMKNNPLVASYAQSYTLASQAIDSLPNELIRYNDPVQFGVMGTNSADAVNSSTTKSILPGVALQSESQNWPPIFTTETNFTVEQRLKGNSALSVSWVWTHASNLDVIDSYNNHPSTLQWETATGTVLPTGGASVIGTPQQNTYAATATGPYDKATWGANVMKEAVGWSNDNALQVNYQRLFHRGSAYQISYVYSKPMRMGGEHSTTVYPDANYPGISGTAGTLSSPYGTLGYAGTPPPARPANLPAWADWHAMDRYEHYILDTGTPKMDIKFNGLIDLPFGKGKKYFANANRFVNELIGGFQLAGTGLVVSQAFQPQTANWGPVNPIQIYKHKVPITDCRTGVCNKAYMWFNGYLPPTAITNCTTKCVTGLPSSYVPFQSPIDTTPGTTYYGLNEVAVTLTNGKQVPLVYDAGPQGASHAAKTFLNGPVNWKADLSLFKVFPIKERVSLRVNMDAFNAFNIQGYNNPGPNGPEEVQPGVGVASSYWAPRQIQLSVRLNF